MSLAGIELFFARKAGQWIAGLALMIVPPIATYFWGHHVGDKAAEARFVVKTAKANKATLSELAAQEKELQREFGLREVFRSGARQSFNQALIEYAGEKHEGKDAVGNVVTYNGISDDGLRLIGRAIDCRERESAIKRSGKVQATPEAGEQLGREGCGVGR